MARLLSLLLLYKAGFMVGRYISLERIVEDTKDGYYAALYLSSQHWHDGKHDLKPWVQYFLGVMLTSAYREFENRVGLVETAKGAKAAMIISAINRLPMRFAISEVAANCPTVGLDHSGFPYRSTLCSKQVITSSAVSLLVKAHPTIKREKSSSIKSRVKRTLDEFA